MNIETQILADLQRDKRDYMLKIERMEVDEDGCTVDMGLLHHYRATLDQIERDIARYTPFKPFEFQNWQAWQGAAHIILSGLIGLHYFDNVDDAINWLMTNGHHAAGRALNAHKKAG